MQSQKISDERRNRCQNEQHSHLREIKIKLIWTKNYNIAKSMKITQNERRLIVVMLFQAVLCLRL